jgi:hypothetical protein
MRSTQIGSLTLLAGDLGQHIGKIVGVFFLHLEDLLDQPPSRRIVFTREHSVQHGDYPLTIQCGSFLMTGPSRANPPFAILLSLARSAA